MRDYRELNGFVGHMIWTLLIITPGVGYDLYRLDDYTAILGKYWLTQKKGGRPARERAVIGLEVTGSDNVITCANELVSV